MGTYVFYGVVTSTAAGIFGAASLDSPRPLEEPADLGRFVVAAVARAGCWCCSLGRPSGGTRVLLTIEGPRSR